MLWIKSDARGLKGFVSDSARVRRGESGGGGGEARFWFRLGRRVSRLGAHERAKDFFVPETKAKQVLARIARSSHHLCGLTGGVLREIHAEDADAANLKTVRHRIEQMLVEVERVHVVGGKRVLVSQSRVRENPPTLFARVWLFGKHTAESSGVFLNLHDARNVRLASRGVCGDYLRRAR